MTRHPAPQTGRSNLLFLVAAALIVIATGAVLIYQSREPAVVPFEVADTRGTVERSEPPPAEPVPEAAPPQAVAAATKPEPLPALDASDGEIRQRLLALSEPGLQHLLGSEALLRKFVVLVDNIARGKIAPRYNPVQAPSGTFTTVSDGSVLRADPAGFTRYDGHARALLAIDAKALVALYWRYYPLLQQAYVDLGYPRAQFHPRMLAALDVLIAAPLLPADAELVQPKVLYQYADPRLEALPAAQKQLMRMGPDNQARVQQYLHTLRTLLAQQ